MNATQGGLGPLPGNANLPDAGCRPKEARAGVIVMNVLNLCRHLQVRDEHDHRATAIGLIVARDLAA